MALKELEFEVNSTYNNRHIIYIQVNFGITYVYCLNFCQIRGIYLYNM